MFRTYHIEKIHTFQSLQRVYRMGTSFIIFILHIPIDLGYHLNQEFRKHFV